LSRLLLLTVPIIFTAPAERPVGRAPGIEKQSKPCMQSKLHEVYPNKALTLPNGKDMAIMPRAA
jgi:hypothetical protein